MGRPRKYENPNDKYDRPWKWCIVPNDKEWYQPKLYRNNVKNMELRERIRNASTS